MRFALTIWICVIMVKQGFCQDIILCEEDEVTFELAADYWGTPVIEYSSDLENWIPTSIQINESFLFTEEQNGFYRLRMMDFDCLDEGAAYGEQIKKVEVASSDFEILTDFVGDSIPLESNLTFWITNVSLYSDITFFINDVAFGSENGEFLLENITENFSIYVSVVYSGSECIFYSDTLDFAVELPFVCGQTFEDPRDGTLYSTVEINGQCWFAENLKYAGSILEIVESTDWILNNTFQQPGWCWFENDSASYELLYGKLYNSFSLEGDSLCPNGWTIPEEDDINSLLDFLGNEAGTKLKAGTLWNSDGVAGTNESGFTAFPGGKREWFAQFEGISDEAFFWTYNEASEIQSVLKLTFDSNEADIEVGINNSAASCRCIME